MIAGAGPAGSRGTVPLESLAIRSPDHYRDLGIEVELGVEVQTVRPGERVLELAGGDEALNLRGRQGR